MNGKVKKISLEGYSSSRKKVFSWKLDGIGKGSKCPEFVRSLDIGNSRKIGKKKPELLYKIDAACQKSYTLNFGEKGSSSEICHM